MKKCMVVISVIALLGLFSVVFAAGKADGTWESERQGRQGQATKTTYKFQCKDDGTVTGTVSNPRWGDDIAIQDGKLEGDTLTFKVVRDFNGNEMVTKYTGKVAEKEITFTREREGGFAFGGGRGAGGPQGGPGMGTPRGGGQGGPGAQGAGNRGNRNRQTIAKKVE
jgi:hypothetical protein